MNPLSKDACPACGQPNQCAMAGGADPQGCWCMQTPVSRAALARLPAQESGQRCICPVCARESDPASVAAPAQPPRAFMIDFLPPEPPHADLPH